LIFRRKGRGAALGLVSHRKKRFGKLMGQSTGIGE
jgi:hypothetical protein